VRYDLPAVMVLEAPPPGGCGPRGALDGDSGDRLASRVLGGDASRDRLLSGLDRVNLIDAPGVGVTTPWDAARAARSAQELAPGCHGRVVVLAGRRVLRAFRSAVPGIPDLRPGARLAWANSEWLVAPHPSGRCRWWNDPDASAAMSATLRAEVERYEAAATSWSTFGEDALEAARSLAGSAPAACFAYRVADASVRVMPEASAAGWADGEVVGRLHPDRPVLVDALVRNLARVLRWGGASKCSVLAHSARVGLLARAAARAVDLRADQQVACSRLGAGHDLAEALPGIGDVPSPAKRWMSRAGGGFQGAHIAAECLVDELCDLPVDAVSRAVVKWADLASMAVERAAYFGDAPPWLGSKQAWARLVLDGSLVGDVRSRDVKFDHFDLGAMVSGQLVCHAGIEHDLVAQVGREQIEREIFGGAR